MLIKDVGTVSVGYRPRLGILGRDTHDDVVGAIVVQRRTEKTADMIPKVEAAIRTLNHDGSLPPGVKVVPFYDRSSLIALTTHTVLHNLIFGCLLVFLIQWIFLGDLRSAVIVGINIPFALFFATILLVVMGVREIAIGRSGPLVLRLVRSLTRRHVIHFCSGDYSSESSILRRFGRLQNRNSSSRFKICS